MRARRSVALGTALLLCLAGAGPVAARSVAAASASAPATASAPSHRELERAVEPLQALATDLFPEQFAGLWATGSGSDVEIKVAFADNALLNTTALSVAAQFLYPDLLLPVEVATPLVALEQLLALMSSEREAVRRGDLAIGEITSHRFDLAVDLPGNRIVVTAPLDGDELSTWQSAFRARYGPLVDVAAGSITGPQGCRTRKNCGRQLRAGLRLGSPGGYYCSSGFTVVKGGKRRVLSAGHCGNSRACRGRDDGAARFHHGRRYGVVSDQACTRQVDAEIHTVNSRFRARPWLWLERRDVRHPVTASTEWTQTVQGLTRVCKAGAASSQRCGHVINKYVAPSYVPYASRFVLTDYCAIPGDSGAAVYRRFRKGRAEGVHAGGNVDGPARCANWNPRRDFSVYGHIEFALRALDARMLYQR